MQKYDCNRGVAVSISASSEVAAKLTRRPLGVTYELVATSASAQLPLSAKDAY